MYCWITQYGAIFFLTLYFYPFSGTTTVSNIGSSGRKPLPLKSGSCLEILKPSKPATDDETVKEDAPANSVCTNEKVYHLYLYLYTVFTPHF